MSFTDPTGEGWWSDFTNWVEGLFGGGAASGAAAVAGGGASVAVGVEQQNQNPVAVFSTETTAYETPIGNPLPPLNVDGLTTAYSPGIGGLSSYLFGRTFYVTGTGGADRNPQPVGSQSSYQLAFQQAFQFALRKVTENKTCGAFYGGQGADTLNSTAYKFYDFGADRTSVGAMTVNPSLVFLNVNPASPFMQPPSAILGIRTPTGIRGLMILHELGHQLKRFTGFVPDASSQFVNDGNTWKVRAKCF